MQAWADSANIQPAMALNPRATARRNVAERIDRFLTVLDRAGGPRRLEGLIWAYGR